MTHFGLDRHLLRTSRFHLKLGNLFALLGTVGLMSGFVVFVVALSCRQVFGLLVQLKGRRALIYIVGTMTDIRPGSVKAEQIILFLCHLLNPTEQKYLMLIAYHRRPSPPARTVKLFNQLALQTTQVYFPEVSEHLGADSPKDVGRIIYDCKGQVSTLLRTAALQLHFSPNSLIQLEGVKPFRKVVCFCIHASEDQHLILPNSRGVRLQARTFHSCLLPLLLSVNVNFTRGVRTSFATEAHQLILNRNHGMMPAWPRSVCQSVPPKFTALKIDRIKVLKDAYLGIITAVDVKSGVHESRGMSGARRDGFGSADGLLPPEIDLQIGLLHNMITKHIISPEFHSNSSKRRLFLRAGKSCRSIMSTYLLRTHENLPNLRPSALRSELASIFLYSSGKASL